MRERLIRELERRRFRPLDLIDRESRIEKILALTLAGEDTPWRNTFFAALQEDFARFNLRSVRAVVFGGGSGLSSVVGGNSHWPAWRAAPFVGLKELLPHLTVAVCTTDDGGSTGLLRRDLELFGVGDLRKVALSMVRAAELRRRYGLDEAGVLAVVGALQRIVTYRFPATPAAAQRAYRRILADPFAALAPDEAPRLPLELRRAFAVLGRRLRADPALKRIQPAGHCLGNLYLVASMYEATRRRPPSAAALLRGIQRFAALLGAPGEQIFPATTTPGQLRFLYENGVFVCGQRKALETRRGYAVERVVADYVAPPEVPPRLLQAVAEADLILFAPGSVFSSLLPILQIEPIAEAVRANRNAVKILAPGFWVQEGETDISRRGPQARYHVSDLLLALDRNVPGGVHGLFRQVLVADLKQLPGHVLRNYALEGKFPIFLDRPAVRRLGFEPIEAPVFAQETLARESVLHHDPEQFGLAVKTLLYVRRLLRPAVPRRARRNGVVLARRGGRWASPNQHMEAVRARLRRLRFRPARLRHVLWELLWTHRDILPEHLDQIAGVAAVPPGRWARSTAWDKVLGYYDPDDRQIKIHASLLAGDPERLREDLLIGLGEALLGRYWERKWVAPVEVDGEVVGKVYRIRLAPPEKRGGFLTDAELRSYLELAHMRRSRRDPNVYRRLVNAEEAFTPPGLLFGLVYAWYLDNRYGGLMDYEMSLVRWKASDLIPQQIREMRTRRRLITFFRRVVFRHEDPAVERVLAANRRGLRHG